MEALIKQIDCVKEKEAQQNKKNEDCSKSINPCI